MRAALPLVRSRDSREPARPSIDARTYAAFAAAVSVALGSFVLVGWWLRAPFVEAGDGRGGMLPSNAASLALGGLSLWLATRPAPDRGTILCARGLAVVVVALALASLAAFGLGLEIPLAQAGLTREHVAILPSPNASLAFGLVGAALLLRGSGSRLPGRASELLAGAAVLIALLALFGHVYGAAALHEGTRSLRTVGVTPAGAIGLIVLATGTLSVSEREGLAALFASPTAGGQVARRLLVGLLLIPVLGVIVTLGHAAGLYSAPEAAAILAVCTVFLGLAWVLGTGRALDRSDAERLRAEADAGTWRLFFERADWGAVIASDEGRIELVNRAFAELHGYARDEMIGVDLHDLVPDDQRGRVADALDRVGARLRSEHLRRDGARFPVLIEATQIEANGARHRAVLVQDLTDLVRAEGTRARLASLVSSSADAIYGTSIDGTVLDWNAAAERLYGFTADEIVGRSVRTLAMPGREGEIDDTIARLLRGERVTSFETERKRKDGSRVQVAITVSAIVDSGGRITGFSAIARDVTARKQMEEALRRSEQRARELFEHASDGIYVADVRGRITDVNHAACALTGHVRGEIVGRRIADLVAPEDVPRIARERAAVTSGHTGIREWSMRRRDGTYVPVEVSAKVLADGRWQGFVRDIGERKKYERELRLARDAERALRAELELVMRAGAVVAEELAAIPESGLGSLLHTIALQAQMLTGADAAAVAMGLDPGRAFDHWAFAGEPELERAVGSFARSHVNRGGCFQEVVRADQIGDLGAVHAMLGVPIWHGSRCAGCLFLASSSEHALGESAERVVEMLAGRMGAALETARAYASEALGRAWLSAVIDQMPEGLVIVDERGRAPVQNAAALRFARTTEPERWREAYVIRDSEGAPMAVEEWPLTRALERGETIVGEEVALVAPDGEVVPVVVSATPVRSGDRVAGAVAVFQDIQALKELERLRGEWASVIAHDLRQPLNVISMSTGVVRKRAGAALGDIERKLLDRVMSSTRALTRMIDDLLDASRIEARRLSLERSEHDVCTVVHDVVERHREQFVDRPLDVRCCVPALACIDPGRIEQVVVNLLTNAEKYGEPGTPIQVEVESRPRELELAVTNHGPGIPASEVPLLFQRFARTRDARHGKAGGIGLGLYICKGIIEAHGGRIWVESVPGDTTTFRIMLPRNG